MENQVTIPGRGMYHPGRIPLAGILLWFLFLQFSFRNVSAQIQANFKADTTQGCSPVVVNFLDQSTGNPVSWHWDFGNGNQSTKQNPSAIFANQGTYSVTLTVKDALGNSSSLSQTITVFANPTVNFTPTAVSGCYPLTVNFKDQSTPGSGTLVSWLWDFGNGDVATQQNPAYTYTKSGTYNIQLVVTNSYGCIGASASPSQVTVPNGVSLSFSASQTTACQAPATITFTNNSTGPGTMSYSWDFGDGSNSSQPSPTHTYTAAGTYTVTLNGISSAGCSGNLQKSRYIDIASYQSSIGIPSLLCTATPELFQNSGSGSPVSSVWTFSDGQSYNAPDITRSFSVAGNYSVQLVDTYSGGCTDTADQGFQVIASPLSAFTADTTLSCSAPLTVQFTDQSSGGSAWFWTFGDGVSSTSRNPVHTYRNPGSFSVKEVVTNAGGCSDSLIRNNYIRIVPPSMIINANPLTGCVPLTVQFSSTVSSLDSIVAYSWNFGDGQSGTGPNPSHTYSVQGTYSVSLTVTTAGGCTSTLVYGNPIVAGDPPNVQFIATPLNACASTPIKFTDQSSKGNQWLWDFGDGSFSSLQNPNHLYGDTGYFNVTLTVTNMGCQQILTKPRYIHILPPIAAFTDTRDCPAPYLIQFQDHSIGATQWAWNFGDTLSTPQDTSTQTDPSHTFSATGIYTVILQVTNGLCSSTATKKFQIIDEHPDFSISKDSSCRNNTLTLTATGIHTANISNYHWEFGGGMAGVNTTNPVLTQNFPNPGLYTITLITTNLNGCTDTVSKTDILTITGPTADFSSNAQICLGSVVNFTDKSTSAGYPLKQWIWNYGDGTPADTLMGPPYSHTYAVDGSYNVQLTVVDSSGCSNSVTKPAAVNVTSVQANFYSPDTLSCPGKPIRFINQSQGAPVVTNWDFGDGQSSGSANPIHTYASDSLYTIKLILANAQGCTDTLIRPQYIRIASPKASFSITNLSVNQTVACPPFVATCTNTSKNYQSAFWNFGDGSNSVKNNPTHVYDLPGTYSITLTITSYGGCVDSVKDTFTIKGPVGLITSTPLFSCSLPVSINFTATSKNSVIYRWDFGDGNISPPTTDSTTSHVYTQRGNFKPVLILQDASGCQVSYISADSLVIDQIQAGFVADKYTVCDSGFVSLTDSSHSYASDTLGYPNTYHWDFGVPGSSSDTSDLRNPTYFYNVPGTYIITQTVRTHFGCARSDQDTIRVVGRTHIGIAGPVRACAGTTFALSGYIVSGGPPISNWRWNFGNGDSSALQNPLPVSYDQAGQYSVRLIGTNTEGCSDTALHSLRVDPVPVPQASPGTVRICLGASVQLMAQDGVTYQWSPSTWLNDSAIADPLAIPQGNIQYQVLVTNAFGCSGRDSVSIQVSQPFSMLAGPDTTICAGQAVPLWARGGASHYAWIPPDFLDSAGLANPISLPDTTVTYTVIGYGHDACFSDTQRVRIQVVPLPTVHTGPDQTVTVGSQVQLNAVSSPDVINYAWTPPDFLDCTSCQNPLSTPRHNITYKVQVANAQGCKASSQVSITLICSEGVVYIPNTFTPNGDGINDLFYPRGKGVQTIKYFRIYDRWGQLVFEQDNFNLNEQEHGWNGKFHGQALNPDVYVYVTEMVCDNGESFMLKGNVTLLR